MTDLYIALLSLLRSGALFLYPFSEEGGRLSHEQTRYIFETNTIDAPDGSVNVDDILETVNHFRCIDLVIDQAKRPLTETMIKQLHLLLKSSTADSRKSCF